MLSAFDVVSVLLIAAAASAGLIAALRPLIARYALAQPNARSSHATPTPQGGGIAVIAATLIGLLAAVALSAIATATILALWPLAAAVAVLAVTGVCDDIFHVPVGARLVLQFVAVGLVVAVLPDHARVVPLLPWWIERVVLLIGGVYVVNVVNFMDGIDLMTVAEVVPVAGGLYLLSLAGAVLPHESLVAVALLGAMLGFAPFNRPVAKLFLGDVGSLPIGLLLFWLLLQLATRGHLAAALLLPLYYLADATVTLLRRIARRENVLEGHRSHFYQRATDRGIPVVDVVGRVCLVNVLLALLAVASVVASSPWLRMAAPALGVAAVAGLLAHFARGRS
jgi:UDP-N-acetylmuramyl pentapeptide phosphotransferase/UDP-N-acetylglucosamine-1-phosphate transferase